MTLRSKLLEEIKQSIKEGRETIHSISVGAGVEYSVLHRFVKVNRGKKDGRNIKLDTAEKLRDFFGLELTYKK